jgi:hypothetical protein
MTNRTALRRLESGIRAIRVDRAVDLGKRLMPLWQPLERSGWNTYFAKCWRDGLF